MNLGNLVTTLILDDKISSGLKKASGNINSFSARSNKALAKAQKQWQGFGNRLKTVGKIAVGLVASGGALYLLAKKSLDYADTIAKTADKIGVSTDALQEFRFVADRAGVATSMFDNGLVAFSKRFGELRQGTGALNTYLQKLDEQFKQQVISAGSVDEALMLVFNRMNEMSRASDRAALGAAAFSRSAGVAMVNMAGSADVLRKRARALGIVIDENMIRNSETAIDSITDLSYVLKANLNRSVVALAPVISDIATDMANWIAANDDFLKQKVPQYVNKIADGMGRLFNFMSQIPAEAVEFGMLGYLIWGKKGIIIGAALGKYFDDLSNFAHGLELVKKGFIGLDEYIKMSSDEREKLLKKYEGTGQAVRKPIINVPPQTGGFDTPSLEPNDEYTKTLADLAKKQADFEFQVRQLDRDTWEQKRQGIYRWADLYQAKLSETGKFSQDELDNLASQISRVASSELKLVAAQKKIEESSTSMSSEIANAIIGWGSQFSSTLNDALWDSENTFENIAESFGKMLTQMVLQKGIVEPLLEKSLGLIGLTGSAHGNVFDNGKLIPYAKGGVINKPHVFPMANGVGLAGEAGPEAIMPLTRVGKDLGVKSTGGNGVNVYLQNPIFQDAETQRRMLEQIATVIAYRVAPDAVISSYDNAGPIRNVIRNPY